MDNKSIIVEEANRIVENYIKRKRNFTLRKRNNSKGFPKIFILSILTVSIVCILLLFIKII